MKNNRNNGSKIHRHFKDFGTLSEFLTLSRYSYRMDIALFIDDLNHKD